MLGFARFRRIMGSDMRPKCFLICFPLSMSHLTTSTSNSTMRALQKKQKLTLNSRRTERMVRGSIQGEKGRFFVRSALNHFCIVLKLSARVC